MNCQSKKFWLADPLNAMLLSQYLGVFGYDDGFGNQVEFLVGIPTRFACSRMASGLTAW